MRGQLRQLVPPPSTKSAVGPVPDKSENDGGRLIDLLSPLWLAITKHFTLYDKLRVITRSVAYRPCSKARALPPIRRKDDDRRVKQNANKEEGPSNISKQTADRLPTV